MAAASKLAMDINAGSGLNTGPFFLGARSAGAPQVEFGSMNAIAIIPARLASERLPRKVLLAESGKTLIEHVYERARAAKGLSEVVVATDSSEVIEACRSFGARAIMTSASHTSGTDRVAEAARLLQNEGHRFDLVINVQGDEPELDPALIETLIDLLRRGAPMASLCEPIRSEAEAELPQLVKVVLTLDGRALYFSRARIPFPRRPGAPCYRHIGLYGFKASFLQSFTKLPPSSLEQTEGLEQLRALENGFTIQMGIVQYGAQNTAQSAGLRGIDTREDYDAFLARLRGS